MSVKGADALQRLLAEAVQDCVSLEDPPLELAGARLEASLHPRSREQLAEALRALSSAGAACVVQGGGSRPGLGNPVQTARVRLSTAGLCGIEELDLDDGVLRAAAGTPLHELRAALAAHAWELPLDPPGRGSTLGGSLASAASGPRRLAFGPTRDCVLGLDVVLASGEHTRCGGRVVKNVTGYDLARLYVGSLGSLGVIEAAWLRLRPVPPLLRTRCGGLADTPETFALALEAARRPSARVLALVSRPLALSQPALRACIGQRDAWLLVCELAADEPTCSSDAEWLDLRGISRPGGPGQVEAVRALEAGEIGASAHAEAAVPPAPGPEAAPTLRACLRLLPTALPRVCRRLAERGFALLVQPVPGLVHASLMPPIDPRETSESDRVSEALCAIEWARREGAGEYVLESLPAGLHAQRDVFSYAADALPLMRALKARFDPKGVLNPGRFAGGL